MTVCQQIVPTSKINQPLVEKNLVYKGDPVKYTVTIYGDTDTPYLTYLVFYRVTLVY